MAETKQDESTQEKKEVKASETPAKTEKSELVDRQIWEAATTLRIRKEMESLLVIWKQNDLKELEGKNNEIIQAGLQKMFDDWKAKQEPPSHDKIQELLDQEYETFKINVLYFEGDQEKTMLFTLRELPQSVEKKFFKMFKDRILGNSQKLAAFSQSEVEQPFEHQVKAFLELFDESLDILPESVAMCLNPFEKKKEITTEWVRENISSDRQWGILEAQMKINRIRDFFSRVSASGQETMTMMRPPSIQQLRQHVA